MAQNSWLDSTEMFKVTRVVKGYGTEWAEQLVNRHWNVHGESTVMAQNEQNSWLAGTEMFMVTQVVKGHGTEWAEQLVSRYRNVQGHSASQCSWHKMSRTAG